MWPWPLLALISDFLNLVVRQFLWTPYASHCTLTSIILTLSALASPFLGKLQLDPAQISFLCEAFLISFRSIWVLPWHPFHSPCLPDYFIIQEVTYVPIYDQTGQSFLHFYHWVQSWTHKSNKWINKHVTTYYLFSTQLQESRIYAKARPHSHSELAAPYVL